MARPRLRVVALSAVLVIVASACFGGGGGGGAQSTRHQSATPAAGDPQCQFIVASEGKRSIPSSVTQAEYLVDATVTATVCYDKITFVFDHGDAPDLPPGYTIQYAKPPFAPQLQTATEALSGAHAILEVIITPAGSTDVRHPSSPVQTYKGNLRLHLQATRHTQIVEYLSTFPQASPDPNAASMVWLIGLDSKRPFTADAANGPSRVSVLIMN